MRDLRSRLPRPPVRIRHAHTAARHVAGRFARHRVPRFALALLGLLAVAALGAGAGFALAPATSTWVGPLQTEVRVLPSLDPGVRVELPPVGEISFDTHHAPVAVTANIASVDLDAASRLVSSPQQLLALELTVTDTIKAATLKAAVTSLVCGLAGALLAGVVVYRGVRRTLQTGALCLVAVLATGGTTALTIDPAALQQPRFTGLLSRAPYVVTNAQSAMDRLESYRSGLSDIVTSVSTLYAVSADLPVLGDAQVGASGLGEDVTTVLHISDLHLNPLGLDLARTLVGQFGVQAVVDTGDITTWGTAVEATYLDGISELGVPYVFVRGNHDSRQTQAAVAAEPNAIVLDDGDVAEVAGLRLAGVGDPVFTPDGEGQVATGSAEEVQRTANERLAAGIETWDEAHPDDGVDVALVHQPTGLEPVLGRVPLVLAGHLHSRKVTLDASGTRIMVEGSTGGAGITSAGLARLADGTPVPLSATLLYFGTSGEQTGRLLAYDEVTVGGLGLASVNLQRTVLGAADRPSLTPGPADTSATTGAGGPSGTATGLDGSVETDPMIGIDESQDAAAAAVVP